MMMPAPDPDGEDCRPNEDDDEYGGSQPHVAGACAKRAREAQTITCYTRNARRQFMNDQVSHLPALASRWRILRKPGFRAGNLVHARSKIMTPSKTSGRRFWEFKRETTRTYREFLARSSRSARIAVNRTLVG